MFGRKKKGSAGAEAPAPEQDAQDQAGAAADEAAELRARGPWDISESEDREDRMDFGSLLIKQAPGVGIRLEVSEKGNRPRAVNLDHQGSTVQLQAFAAPRTLGIWDEIRKDLVDSLKRGDGAPQAVEGPFGTELRARFPATSSDGTKGYRPARFIGIDGPRWFLRAVISGPAAIEPQASAAFDEMIRTVIVRRGTEPMPPRDLLPLQVPEGVAAKPVATRRTVRRGAQGQDPAASRKPAQAPGSAQAGGSARGDGARGPAPTAPPERGPEITETR